MLELRASINKVRLLIWNSASSHLRFELANYSENYYLGNAELAASMRRFSLQLVQKGTMEKRILELALEALQAQKLAIEAEIEQLVSGMKFETSAPAPLAGIRRGRSEAQRKAHSERMKKIWAARKARVAKPRAAKQAVRNASHSSAANKARSEKMRAYWAGRRKKKQARNLSRSIW